MLDTYYVNINDDDCFMNAISLVTYPAVEHDFLKFEEDKPVTLHFADETKHMISGVVCLANTPIYRRRTDGYEYNIVFTPEVIEQMCLKYSKMGLMNSVNLQHDDKQYVDSVIMVEMFIKNSATGIDPIQFKDVPDGSLFCTFKIEDEQLWNEIKKDNSLFRGFSLEIECTLDKEKMEINKTDDEVIDDYLNELFK